MSLEKVELNLQNLITKVTTQAQTRARWSALAPFILAGFLQGCATLQGSSNARHPASPSSASATVAVTSFGPTAARPWELIDPLGQTILSNIFYAEDAENEQLMPLTMPNHRTQISRLIYPTLGNPRLFVRTRESDLGVFVLRLENEVFAQSGLQTQLLDKESHLVQLTAAPGSVNELSFYLVKREKVPARDDLNPEDYEIKQGSQDPDPALQNAYLIHPTRISAHQEFPGMPPVLGQRKTLQVEFSKRDLADVPAGLYDVCFTLKNRTTGDWVLHHGLKVYETQFNAFRIFDEGPEAQDNRYTAINVSDAQVSLGITLRTRTVNMLAAFVNTVNQSKDPKIRNASFITFNGDLHNSGAPLMHRPRTVLNNYNRESWLIMSILRELDKPIFLIQGNHDGYANMGHTSGEWFWETKRGARETLIDVVLERPNESRTWPDFAPDKITELLKQTQAQLPASGRHLNIFSGRFHKREGVAGWAAWQEIPLEKRNVITYDGFYQWQRTYGPQYSSFVFGQNRYVNANSFELRQHRRVGWGLYSTNYGGNISAFQMDWIRSEFNRGTGLNQDLIFLAHHDPRGGHKGLDYPYYFKQLDFAGVGPNFTSYVKTEVLKRTICDGPLAIMMKHEKRTLFCTHDGLQEWMRSDKEFDCPESIMKPDGTCDTDRFSYSIRPYYSGYDLVDLWARTENLRTIILGHTHFHSLEVLQGGDEKTDVIVPRRVILDFNNQERLANMDPARNAASVQAKQAATEAPNSTAAKYPSIPTRAAENWEAYRRLPDGKYELDFDKAGFKFKSHLQGKNRELVIIRVAPSADITGQRVEDLDPVVDEDNANKTDLSDRHMHGFSVFEIYPKDDRRQVDLPQLNWLRYYVDTEKSIQISGPSVSLGEQVHGATNLMIRRKTFEKIFKLGEFKIDRTQYLKRTDEENNPVLELLYRGE